MEYVLLSAIGDSDPIRDGYDGPSLHIVRKYRPKKVYLIFTAAMQKRDIDTNCYERAICYLEKECIVDKTYTDIENASDFDAFHNLFSETINRIRLENPEAKILLNVSSGTPQMNTTMCLEVVSHSLLLQPVQVSSPNRSSNVNTSHFDPYTCDLEDELHNLLDNLDDAPNRCSEPGLIGIRRSMIRNQVKSLIINWEYKGAYDLINENALLFTERLKLILHHAYLRSLPEEKGAEDIAKMLDVYYALYPVRNNDAKPVCDYYLATSLRMKRKELNDFLLRVSALAEHLLKMEVDDALGGIDTIADENSKNGSLSINHEKVAKNHPNLARYLDTWAYNINTYTYESINKYLANQGMEISGYNEIFDLRNKRNDSAHSIKSMSESDYKDVDTTPEMILHNLQLKIKSIFGKEIVSSVFNVFETINAIVIKELDSIV
ncbi:MAG: hypothetical protein FWG88_04040 [Oscillospiraceae bacterium]|nr:hypothetical protein [Oscillospiraceae bacterium]